MVSVEGAYDIVLSNLSISQKTSDIEEPSSAGLFLMEDIVSDRDYPPFDRVMMDGVAVCAEEIQGLLGERGVSEVEIPLIGFQKAGMPPLSQEKKFSAVEVSTGAPLPLGTDCVVPYEEVFLKERSVTLRKESIKPRMHIAMKGEDAQKGESLIRKGVFLEPQQYPVLASVGKRYVLSPQFPRIGILSTGDELVEIGESHPSGHFIRRSNDLSIEFFLRRTGFDHIVRRHAKDDLQSVHEAFEKLLEESEVVFISGGVSMGKKDFVKEVVAQQGCRILFHKASQRPGKPLLFARKEEKLIFGLPGNPNSSIVCLRRYFIEAFFDKLGWKSCKRVTLGEDFEDKKRGLTFFIPVREEGYGQVSEVRVNGSGDFIHMGRSSGLIEIPKDVEKLKKGMDFAYFPWIIR